ncbi:MAG: TIGR01906 family membrane protein [Anaerolineaceae bacterium]|nr:TIGR01906 family membrane protein [Anaerolineaceae bacterium]
MSVIRFILKWMVALTVPLLLLVGSARLAMVPVFLQFEYTRPGFEVDYYGFTVDDRLAYGFYALDYILNGEDISFLGDLTLPGDKCYPPQTSGDCAMFNDLELSHMVDVKQVAQMVFAAALIMLIMDFVIIGLGIRVGEVWPLNALRLGSLLTIGAIVGIVFAALFAWDTFFALFHSLFFEDGTWQFYYSDTLIRLYPEQFWLDAAIFIGGMSLLGAAVLLFVAPKLARTHLDHRQDLVESKVL